MTLDHWGRLSPLRPNNLRRQWGRAQQWRRRQQLPAGHVDIWREPPWDMSGPEPTFPGLGSQACTDNQMRTKHYRVWADRLRTDDVYVHRKQWEWFFIAQALLENGALVHGAKGLGFGVGSEPMAAWFAAQGCTIVATDYPGGDHADAWSSTGELARSVADLNVAGICPDDDFARLVTYRAIDMRDLSTVEEGFDFSWSSCVIEHLGSIEATLRFLVDHLDKLRPGAISVHTTELNLSSATETISTGPTVLLRQNDFVELEQRLDGRAAVIPFNWNTGHNPNDRFVAQTAATNTQLRFRNHLVRADCDQALAADDR
jgi:hypothetical protein